MATKKTTTRKPAATRKRPAVKKAAKPAAKRAAPRRPGAAESVLASLGKRADAAGERLGQLAQSGGRVATESLESAKQSANSTLGRARKSWDGLDPKGKAGVVAGGLAALAVAVAAPLVAKRKKK